MFGLDQAGKPKAGRFPDRHAAVAKKAALALNLTACTIDRPKLLDLVTEIPAGRLHAQGKAFIPYVKQSLFERLQEAVRPATAAMPATSKASPSVTAVPQAKPPKDWDSIAVGDLVLCQEGPREGFWEAIVIDRDGDNLTSRFRDYPRLPPFKCTIYDVALIHVKRP